MSESFKEFKIERNAFWGKITKNHNFCDIKKIYLFKVS